MDIDAWLPIGHSLPNGTKVRRTVAAGDAWQIVEADGGKRALLAQRALATRWAASGLIDVGALEPLSFGAASLAYLVSGPEHVLCGVAEAKGPRSRSDALAFATALRESRGIDIESPLQDAIYVEKLSRLLPTYTISSRTDDEVVLGSWLTGGAPIPAGSFRRLHQGVSWLSIEHLKEVVETAGFEVRELVLGEADDDGQARGVGRRDETGDASAGRSLSQPFELPGRPELEAFINEHIVDVLRNRERYKALGVGFPSAVVLHGPPGSGKTYAVERLVEYLGWPSYHIDASSVASPYIHETSRKVAEVFEAARQSAPSVLVIDEMEAFLADREIGSGHHRVEEVAEFLRRIPEATKNDVLIIGMTNRIAMIDAAILRRGRFDHLIQVGHATKAEILALLRKLLSDLPTVGNLDVSALAGTMADRPLSDVAFVVREAARVAARSGKSQLDQASLDTALRAAPAREADGGAQRRIGFI